MTNPTNFRNRETVPNVGTRKSAPSTTNFSKGIKTYKPNDEMSFEEIYLAQDARFDRIGEYKTRHGYDKMCEPIGKTTAFDNTASTVYSTSLPTRETSFTLSAGGNLYSLTLKLKTTDSVRYGVPQLVIKNSDGEVIAESFANPENITDEFVDVEFIFNNAPSVEQGDVLNASVRLQEGGERVFNVGTVSNGSLMLKASVAASGHVSNVFEANIDGTKTILFTFIPDSGTPALYRMAANGTVTKIRDLPSGVKKVRFNQAINQIRYTDGKEGVRLLNPASSWSDTLITQTDVKAGGAAVLDDEMSNIMNGGQNNIIYFTSARDDEPMDTLLTWCLPYNYERGGQVYASYDNFDVELYENIPAIKTGDPVTAMFSLGGVIYVLTRRNKYMLYFQEADVWSQSTVNAQNGTFSQESVVCDLNYAYFASDSGVFIFDGSSETSITETSIQNTYDSIKGKESIVVELYDNKLFVFYSSKGIGTNDSCLVYNLNLGVWESFDTGTYVSAATARQTASNRFICGHSRVGMLMLAESIDNAYDNLCGALKFDLDTAYHPYGTPSQLKSITKWRPEFASTKNPYTVACGYAMDFSDEVKYAFSVNLKNNAPVAKSYVWDNPSNYGLTITPTKMSFLPKVYGQFRRCQIRYQHHAAFEPVNFKSHTVTIQTQRIR